MAVGGPGPRAGQRRTQKGRAEKGRTEKGRAGQCIVGQGRAGQGRARQRAAVAGSWGLTARKVEMAAVLVADS